MKNIYQTIGQIDEKSSQISIIQGLIDEQGNCRSIIHNIFDSNSENQEKDNESIGLITDTQWTHEQQQLLLELHDQIGNKWSIIGQRLSRIDNSVKNHFFSKLRKSIRWLNKLIKSKFNKDLKQLNSSCIYKIIEALEQRFIEKPSLQTSVLKKCQQIKQGLLKDYGEQNYQAEADFVDEKELIKSIIEFNKIYRKKNKKERRKSTNGGELFKRAVLMNRIKYYLDKSNIFWNKDQYLQNRNKQQIEVMELFKQMRGIKTQKQQQNINVQFVDFIEQINEIDHEQLKNKQNQLQFEVDLNMFSNHSINADDNISIGHKLTQLRQMDAEQSEINLLQLE